MINFLIFRRCCLIYGAGINKRMFLWFNVFVGKIIYKKLEIEIQETFKYNIFFHWQEDIFSFLLSLSEDVIPPPLEDAVLFCVFKLLFKDIIDSTKNQNRPKKIKDFQYKPKLISIRKPRGFLVRYFHQLFLTKSMQT